MRREQLEHVIRAAASITNDDDLVILGSQAVPAEFPEAPLTMLQSMEVDLYPRSDPDLADVIDGAIGEGSLFHGTFGYYAQGVGVDTAILPTGWEDRLVPVSNENTRSATGWCLEIHDLFISKLAALREKDLEYVRAGWSLIDLALLRERLAATSMDDARRLQVEKILDEFEISA